MKQLYYIDTENRHGQFLVFTSKRQAKKWCKKATTWNDEKIEREIFTTPQTWQGFYNIFPKTSIYPEVE